MWSSPGGSPWLSTAWRERLSGHLNESGVGSECAVRQLIPQSPGSVVSSADNVNIFAVHERCLPTFGPVRRKRCVHSESFVKMHNEVSRFR
jgi:hypothetical protein